MRTSQAAVSTKGGRGRRARGGMGMARRHMELVANARKMDEVVVLKGIRRERIGRGGVGTDIESPLHSFLTPLHHQLIPFDPIEASIHG